MISVQRMVPEKWRDWDQFAGRSTQGSLYHQTGWLTAAGRLCEAEPAVWAIFKGSELIGGCAFLESTIGKQGIVGSCCQYNGLLFADAKSSKPYKKEQLLRQAGQTLTSVLREEYTTVSLSNMPCQLDIRPFSQVGWRVEVGYTYCWYTGSMRQLQKRCHNDIQRQLRNASQYSVKSRCCHDWEEVFRLWELSFSRKGLKVRLDRARIGEWYDYLANQGLVETYLAELRGEAVAGVTILKDKRSLYLWFNGLHPEYRNLGGHTLLLWEIMDKYSNNYSVFDLCGGDVPEVAAYKASLGATLTSHFRLTLANVAEAETS